MCRKIGRPGAPGLEHPRVIELRLKACRDFIPEASYSLAYSILRANVRHCFVLIPKKFQG